MGNRYRRLVAGPDVYRWVVRHKHTRTVGADGRPELRDCRETLLLRREGAAGRVEVVFRGGPGRLVAEVLQPSGTVGLADPDGDPAWLNLNLPRVVRAVVDELAAGGTDFEAAGEVDGWDLFGAVAART